MLNMLSSFINNNNNLVYQQKLIGTSTFNILVVYSNLKGLSSFSKKGQLFNVCVFFEVQIFFHVNLFLQFRVSSERALSKTNMQWQRGVPAILSYKPLNQDMS